MKVKRWTTLVIDYARRVAKNWDYYCLVADAYSAGYRQAKEDCQFFNDATDFSSVGNNEVDFEESKDGLHQLSTRTFEKWQKDIDNMPFKDLFKAVMYRYQCEDLRVVEENGSVSFQGTAKRKT